ncbi:MAG: HD domain-containing protein [Bdellovibrio sp.]|nr:HD domain-containing protein [Bdellovibrio sp.]
MQERVSIPPDQLMQVDIMGFRHAIRDITFDVYLKISDDNVARVFSGSTGLDYKRLAQYIQKGVKFLFIEKKDHERYLQFVGVTAETIFKDPHTSPEKKIATLLNMTEQNIAETLAQFHVDEETANDTQKIIHNYVDLMTEKPSTLGIILKLASHGEYLYYHSIAVAIFSMFIARATGQFNKKMIELIGLGGFLHDIGSTQLPKEVVNSPSDLTVEQWKIMHTHPKLGLQMVENNKVIPEEVRYIIYQHHEEPSGHGYPNSIRGPVIYYPAKIVAIADAFSALISKRPFREAYSVEEAIQIIEKAVGKFDKDLVKMLPAIFLRPEKRQAS